MKNTTFAIIAGVSALAAWVAHKRLLNKSREYYASGPAAEEVQDYDQMINYTQNRIDDYRQLEIDEKKAIDKLVKRYMQDCGYKQSRNQIKDLEKEAKKQLQRTLDKDPDIIKMKKDRDFAIAGLKATLEYDKKIAKYRKQIEKAEEEYAAKEAILDDQDTEMVHETITALKRATEDKRDEIVKKAEEAINELEEKLNDAKEEWETKILELTLSKQTEAERERARLEEQTKQKLNDLDRDIDAYRERARKEVIEARTSEQEEIANSHYSDSETLKILKNERAEIIEEVCAKAGGIKMLASYLKSRHISKTAVAVVGSLPIAGILAVAAFTIIRYTSYFMELLKQF